jgi:hypothetical protein
MAGPIYDRMAASGIGSVLADMSEKRQQRAILEQQKQREEAAMRSQVLVAYMQNPSERTYAAAQAAGVQLPTWQPTPQEAFTNRFYSDAASGMASGQAATFDPAYAAVADPKLAAAKPFMDYAGRRFNYANAGTLPPEVFGAQLTEDKVVPTGYEAGQLTETNRHNVSTETETSRHNRVGEGFEGQRTAAQTFKDRLQAALYGENTRQARNPASGYTAAHAVKGGSAAASPENTQEVEALAKQLASGQITFSNVPKELRPAVSALIEQRGEMIVPDSYRKQTQALNGGYAALDKLEEALTKYEKAQGGAKILALRELQNQTSAFTRTLGRAMGEKGVFTDPDKADFERMLSPGTVPTIVSPEWARTYLGNARGFLDSIQKRNESYFNSMQSGGGGKAYDAETEQRISAVAKQFFNGDRNAAVKALRERGKIQ